MNIILIIAIIGEITGIILGLTSILIAGKQRTQAFYFFLVLFALGWLITIPTLLLFWYLQRQERSELDTIE